MATQDKSISRALSPEEIAYQTGGSQVECGELLISNSKYLNSPVFRDLYAQQSLRRLSAKVPVPYLVPQIMKALDELEDPELDIRGTESARLRIPEFAEWLDARYISDLKLEDVKDHAPGTLGADAYAFLANGGKMTFIFTGEPENDVQYIRKRRAQTHDFYHFVTGLDQSIPAEVAVNVLDLASEFKYFKDDEWVGGKSRFMYTMLSATWMRTACHYPAMLSALMDAWAIALQIGGRLEKPLYMVKWEDYLDWQLTDIREEFRLQGVPPQGTWDWTEAYKN
jgi:ubiquinone biosynthesis protein Coq4